jgi:tetratricopeptide (TPR) repeat protein
MISRRLLVATWILPFAFASPGAAQNAGRDVPITMSTVSPAALRIPAKANSEFDKGNDCIAGKEWDKAESHFLKALEIYPPFALALNNLGLVYARRGDPVRARDALKKAVQIDDHMAAALENLAKLDVKERLYPEAETLLEKAIALAHPDLETEVLLASVQLANRHYEKTILTCRKAQAESRVLPASVHYIAASALEAAHRLSEATAELRLFLKEETSGPRADAARTELARLEQTASR